MAKKQPFLLCLENPWVTWEELNGWGLKSLRLVDTFDGSSFHQVSAVWAEKAEESTHLDSGLEYAYCWFKWFGCLSRWLLSSEMAYSGRELPGSNNTNMTMWKLHVTYGIALEVIEQNQTNKQKTIEQWKRNKKTQTNTHAKNKRNKEKEAIKHFSFMTHCLKQSKPNPVLEYRTKNPQHYKETYISVIYIFEIYES